ncbi:MAG: T9SS type A sorting domain-containing protein [Bacteroidota bacterium]
MKIKIVLAILMLVWLAPVNAQVMTFLKTVGSSSYDQGNCIRQTSDGGYITVGQTMGLGAGNSDVYLVKTDSAGTNLWTRTYGGSADDLGNSVQQTSDGGYIIVGTTSSFGTPNMSDVYLIKTDASGIVSWSKTIGGSDNDLGYSVQQTTDGGYIIGGNSYNTIGNFNLYLIKMDSNGTLVWSKTYGGAGTEHGGFVTQTADGGYVIMGDTYSFGLQGGIYIVKTDASGNEVWSKTYGNYMGGNEKLSIQQTADGGYIVATFTIELGDHDACLIKTDSNGNIIWAGSYDIMFGSQRGYSAKQTADGGYIICGSGSYQTWGGVYLVKTNSTGSVQWSRLYYGVKALDVTQTTDGGFVVTGCGVHSGSTEVLLLKTDTNGNSFCNDTSITSTKGSPAITYGAQTSVVSTSGTATSQNTMTSSGGTSASSCSTVGINEITSSSTLIDIYPNPGNGNFSLKANTKIATIKISNAFGDTIHFSEINSEKAEIDLTQQANGIYFYQIKSDNGAFKTGKVIIAN